VRYVLEGSIRRAGDRLRISGQLVDTTTGAHLWADRFDGSLDQVFELQDNVASSVAGVIEPTLQVAEFRRAAQRPTNDLSAYDLYLKAFPDGTSMVKERVLSALDLLKQALDRDPNYGSALALSAIAQTYIYVNGWSDDLGAVRAKGVELARRALRASDDDPVVLANAAFTLATFGEDINATITLMDRALELNPSFARGWIRSGWLRLWAGKPNLAIEHFETFLRLSPRESRAGANLGIGVGHFFARRLEQAQTMLLASLQELSTWPPTYRFLASCYAHMGRLDDASDIIHRLRKVTPLVIAPAEHWRRPEQREFYLEGLRKALKNDPA
jgi:adenylate cyclase